MELRCRSKFERSLGHSVVENVLKSCANKLALLKLRATPQLKFLKNRPQSSAKSTKSRHFRSRGPKIRNGF
jgi:hypothetical protein